MSEWKETTIGEIADVKTGPFGSALLNEQYIKGGTPVITVEHIKDFRICQLDYPSVTDEDKLRLSSYILEEGDIVFSRVGSVDLSAIALKENDGWLFSSRMLRVRPNRKKIDSLFLSYYLRLYGVRKYINNIAVGSTMPSINTQILKSIPIFHCELSEQKQIAKILSNLDQKITLLRVQNQTLEELAQTLFKRWFVEFEFPNENGQPYKSSGGKMIDSELGEIPEGWRVGLLGELSNLKSGYAFKSKDFVDSYCIKAIKIKDLKGKGVVEISDLSSVSEQVTIIERVKYFKLDKGDIVLAMSGNTTGKIGVIPPHDNELYLNQRVGKFFLKDPSYKSFVYNFLMSGNYEERILSMGYGSAQPNINPSQIKSIEMLIPRDEILTNYNGTSEPIYNKVLINNAEIQSLTKLRDTLLPKLMSGELRVNQEPV